MFLTLLAAPAMAESFPDRPLRLLVPYSAGGFVDIVARLVASALSEELKQPVIVENKAGAGGSIATDAVARAAKDGYTLGIGTTGPLTINPTLIRHVGYDPRNDFTPISLIAATPQMLLVHPSVPAHSVAALVAYASAHPSELNFASPGIGSSAHLAGELFKAAAGVDIVHVPYKGNSEALKDVVSGRVQILFSPLATVMPLVETGQLRLLAVAGGKRSPLVPDVPTMAEAGLPEVQAVAWYGLIGPAGMRKESVARLHAGVSKTLERPDIRARLTAIGADPEPSTPAEFAARIHVELDKWRQTIRNARIRPQ